MYNNNFLYNNRNLIFMLVLITNFIVSFSLDAFFVAQNVIADSLQATNIQIGHFQGMWLIGTCLGQFLLAPIVDNYGRRNILILGMLSVTFSAMACFYLEQSTAIFNSIFGPIFGNFSNIQFLILMRLVQGISVATQMLCSRAIINDLFFTDEVEKSKAFSSTITAILSGGVIAPIIAGQMLEIWTWKSLFALMSILSLFLFFSSLYIPETMSLSKSENSEKVTYFSYLSVFNNKKYIGYLIIGSIVFFWIFGTIFCLPAIIMNMFGFGSGSFSLFVSGSMCLAILGSLINKRLLNHYNINTLIAMACSIMFCFSVLLLFAGFIKIQDINIPILSSLIGNNANLIIICLLIFIPNIFTAFLTSNCVTGCATSQPNKIGIAVAVLGIAQFGISSLAFIVAGAMRDMGIDIITVLGTIHLIACIISLLVYATLIKE